MARKCKVCREVFTPVKPMQTVCGHECALTLAKAKREKADKAAKSAERKADREQRAKIKTRAQWMKEAQAAVNRYIRLRDDGLGCVSCDKPASWPGQWHASHFRSVGAASAVRFNTWNIHKSCSICNNWKSGNLSDYEPRLREKIGGDKVDWLRSQNQIVSYSIEYLKRLKAIFTKKAHRLQSKRDTIRS